DDAEILELEQYHLEKEGYEVHCFMSTRGVEEAASDADLLIMDRKLPDIEGSDFIRYIRDKGLNIPVIFVSSKATDADVMEGFVSGGDDYIRKPFDIHELLHRTRAMLKRTMGLSDPGQLHHRDIVIDLSEHKVFIEEREIELTRLEFNLLSYFVRHKNRVVTRETLLREVWNDDNNIQKRTVNVTINRLRKKIDPELEKAYIIPVHGVGYKLI
ncbi:MAG TPA: response regulator transcription factor, partial [Epsilonproteobacteria bacterium]|nr:response regulator transcription factor [Campylobacterota bacterium]